MTLAQDATWLGALDTRFGGAHSDPGPFWPRRRFMRLVREFHAELTA
jgi:hypothetical protein